MNIRSIIYICLTVLGAYVGSESQALAQTRLGLHVTQEELNIWRQRAQSGPYRVAGDVSTNSPGDWMTIVANAKTFASDPLIDNWDGNTNNNGWFVDMRCTGQNQHNGECFPWHSVGSKILHAAFATLVDPTNHNYASQVRTALLNQIARAGTNWNNTTKWPANDSVGDGNAFAIANWLTRFAYAYSYVRSSSVFSASERLAIDTWFSDAGHYWTRNVDYIVRNSGFTQRNTEYDTTINVGGKYADSGIVGDGPGGGWPLYYDCAAKQPGPFGGADHETWNNRSATMIRLGAITSHLNGTLPKDAQTKRWAQMWFKEWMTYAVFPNFTLNEYKRYEPFAPTAGWAYSGFAIGSMTTVADTFARAGDLSLYNFSTSSGFVYPSNSAANTQAGVLGPKTLLKVVQRHASFVNHRSTTSPGWIGTGNGTFCGNPDYLFQPLDNISGEQRNTDTYYLSGNVFFQDNTYKSAYMRTLAGAPPYPASPAASGYAWGGEWYTYPAVLFMFGQMEGRVSPYGGTSTPPSTPPPSPPKTASITVDSTFPGYSTTSIDDGVKDAFGGTASTWASAESSTAPHWIEITLPSSQQINTATIHWAYNDTAYMTSQEMQVQYWNGSSFVTAATMTWPGKDVPSTTVTFPTVTTSKLRFYQPPNQGHPNYPEIIWLTEIDFGGSVASSLEAPTNLLVSFE